MKKIIINQKGAAVLVMIIYLAIISVMIISVIESRLLLSVERFKSLSDTIMSSYKAESSIYDYVNKILNYTSVTFPFGPTTVTLADGTKLLVTGTHDNATNEDRIDITATRPYAVTKLEMIRKASSTTSAKDIEMTLILDCTGSMNEDAGDGRTKVQALKESLVGTQVGKEGLLTTLKNKTAAEKQHIKIGVVVFTVNAFWLTDSFHIGAGTELKPGSLSVDDVYNVINSGFNTTVNTNDGSYHGDSPACDNFFPVWEYTSAGSGFAKAHEYFSGPPPANTKRAEVLITDGVINTRIPHPVCPPVSASAKSQHILPQNAYCSNNLNYCDGMPYSPQSQYGYPWMCYDWSDNCYEDAIAFMTCTMADTGTVWDITNGYLGVKTPDVDIYTVSVYNSLPADVAAIYTTYSVPDGFYNLNNATGLATALGKVMTQIITSSQINIRRVVP